MNINITSNIEFVKQKILEAGEKPCWLCVDDFHNQQPRGDSPASFYINVKMDPENAKRGITAFFDINDINPAAAQKNLVGVILRSLNGENETCRREILRFFLRIDPENSPLLDTSEISPQKNR